MTTGIGIEPLVERFERDHDDYGSIMAKALADRLAEALAECCTSGPARTGATAGTSRSATEELIRERYRGIRPAPGYPACPDHTEKRRLFDLLQAEETTGIRLTETFAMYPASSVSGLYFSHPEARYFTRGQDRARPGARLPPAQGHGPARGRALARAEPELRSRRGGRDSLRRAS